MKTKTTRKTRARRAGFTMIELLVGSSVMLIVIIGALALYQRSNKVAVDQNMYAELQHDVRSAMYLISRDVRMAGVGMTEEFASYFLEGTDNEDQGASVDVRPDRLKLLGNLEDPLDATIQQYQGSSANATVMDFTFENHPYPDEFYDNKYVLVLPNPASGCLAGEVRVITHVTHDTGGTNERFNFSPGLAPGIDPPGGLSGTCPSSDDYDGGSITFINVIEYWLDQTGHYPGLTAGQNGYIGGGEANILYMTMNAVHYPLAQSVENLQFEYNGDMNNDGLLDGFQPWQNTWILDDLSRLRQVRVLVLGRSPRPFVSVSGRSSEDIHLYQRPALSNDPAGLGIQDRHKRFLLESTSSVRNMSIGLYNTGTR